MKRFLYILVAIFVAFSFCACEKGNDRNTDTEIIRPGNNGNPGNNGSTGNPDGGSDGGTDRSGYEVVNTTSFGYGDIEYWGVAYENQPEDIVNWTVYLSADEFNTSDWEGTGEVVVLELFSKGKSSPAAGTYTVESFYENWYSDFSVGDGYIEEENIDGETVQYCGGTWFFVDGYGEYAAQGGYVKIAESGSGYKVEYELHDDDLEITFKGSYTGEFNFYDMTEEYSSYAQTKSQRHSPVRKSAHKSASALKLKVRR